MKEIRSMRGQDRSAEAVHILLRVRPAGSRSTPERLEANLRWLLQVAMPEAKASEALLQRVRALAAAHHARLDAQRQVPAGPQCPDGAAVTLTDSERQFLSLLLTADLDQLPESGIVQAEARLLTERLLNELPGPLREALLLQLVQGLSVPDIARVLACSEQEVEGLLEQARRWIFPVVEGVPKDLSEN